MIGFGEKVLSYTQGMGKREFIANELIYDATLRNLELIGEAATHIPQEARESNSHISWRRIIGTRNRVAHGYLGIDGDVVWDIIESDIPDLLPKLREMLNAMDRPKES